MEPDNGAQKLVSGNSHSLFSACLFPVPIRPSERRSPAKVLSRRALRRTVLGEPSKFLVFFPVTREFGPRVVRRGLHPPPVSLRFSHCSPVCSGNPNFAA